MLVLLLLAVLASVVGAAPGFAYEPWDHHGGASEEDCDAGCHSDAAPTNATCTSCHTGGFKTSGGKNCWSCHYPGQDTSQWSRQGSGCSTPCHGTAAIHTATPVLAKTCADCHESHYADLDACEGCHPSPSERHHGSASVVPSSLELAAFATEVRFGDAVTIAGALWSAGVGLSGRRVTIQAREAGRRAFLTVGSVTTGLDGAFSARYAPTATSDVRAVYTGSAGGEGIAGPAIAQTSVTVRPIVKLALVKRSGAVVMRIWVRRGARLAFRGSVAPTEATGGEIRLVLTKAKSTSAGTTWNVATRVTRPIGDDGRFTWRWLTRKAGRFRLTAVAGASVAYARAESVAVRIRVR